MRTMPQPAPERVFVVAVRRERRADIPANWVDIVRSLEDVAVQPASASPHRIVVRATGAGVARIQATFEGMVWVEESIPHSTAAGSR
jgi:hypothetical protein